MDLKTLADMPPWEWPEDADDFFLGILHDDQSEESDRLLAVELAGDCVVINDALANGLLSILRSGDNSEELRGRAAISLGPILELADEDGFEDPDYVRISKQTFFTIQKTLRKLYMDTGIPKEVRRSVLEASVRSPQDWHRDVVRAAYAGDDEDWKLTGVFSMRYILGFDDQILESLDSNNPDIHYEAICAAGNWGVARSWPHILELLNSEETEKDLLIASIEAAAGINPAEAGEVLLYFTDSDDEDIVDAAHEAIALVAMLTEINDDDEEDESVF